MIRLIKKLGVLAIICITQVGTAYAQLVIPKPETLPGPSTSTQESSTKLKEFFEIRVFGNITQFIISIAGITTLVLSIVSGIRMLIGYGDEEAYTSAKKSFFISLAGFGLSLLSYAIVSIITNLQF